MDSQSEVMALEEQIIRRQMEDTRSALTEKLECLEQEVSETVQGATDAVQTVKETVQDTVGTVKESVQDAVTAVKNTFDLSRQVQRHPWPMLGGSLVAGFLMGRLLERLSATTAPPANGTHLNGTGASPPAQPARRPLSPSQAKEFGGGWLGAWAKPFEPEITKLKALALGTALGLVRDMVIEVVPEQIGPDVADALNSITEKLGGETILGPVVRHFSRTDTLDEGDLDEEFDATEMGRPLGAAYR